MQLNCAIVDADANNRQEMSHFLLQFGVHVVAQMSSVEELTRILAKTEVPQLVIMNIDPAAHENLKKVGHLPRQHPTVSFFVMSQMLDANLLMEAMHLGVKEFIPLPVSEEKLSSAIERVSNQYGMGKKAKVVHVIPTIGGCGSTTVACNVAASMAGSSRTVLVDMDLVRGGVASYFDVRPRFTIADVMESAEKLDRQLLDNALTVHTPSKLSILARPDLPEDTQRVTQSGMQRLTSVLGRTFDNVVIDSMMSIDPIYQSLLQVSDMNVIVMQLNIPSAKNAERFVGTMRRMGIDASKIRVVVNRFEKRGRDIEPQEVERALGLQINWTIPNDFKTAINAINFGEPVVLRSPKAEMSLSLRSFAQSLHVGASRAA